nr:hypothetical protein [Burkholderia pseudomallei]
MSACSRDEYAAFRVGRHQHAAQARDACEHVDNLFTVLDLQVTDRFPDVGIDLHVDTERLAQIARDLVEPRVAPLAALIDR